MKWWVLFMGLVWIAVWDWRTKEISLASVTALGLIGFLFSVLDGGVGFRGALIGMIPGLVLLVVSRMTNGAVGEGDGWLLMAVGSYMGVVCAGVLLWLSAAFLLAAGGIMIWLKKGTFKTRLPWAPFALGAYVFLWAGGGLR